MGKDKSDSYYLGLLLMEVWALLNDARNFLEKEAFPPAFMTLDRAMSKIPNVAHFAKELGLERDAKILRDMENEIDTALQQEATETMSPKAWRPGHRDIKKMVYDLIGRIKALSSGIGGELMNA